MLASVDTGILRAVNDASTVPILRRMSGRDPDEAHRTSTPLELFFDLCFVVAVAVASTELHHVLVEAHYGDVVGYLTAFFAIWWAWMGYTWLASAYDPDDVVFRLLTFVVMAGVLTMAAGLPQLFAEGNSIAAVTGYAMMRLATVALWLRAGHDHPERRRTARLYAGGITLVQLLWIARLGVPDGAWAAVTFLALGAGEIAVPLLAEGRAGATPWHPHHIAERYSLFTIIVLGELLLAATMGIRSAVDDQGLTRPLLLVIAGGLLVVFSLWWLYFTRPYGAMLARRSASVWPFGYGHYFVFAAVAAVGAALAAAVEVVQDEAGQGHSAAAMALAVAVSVYLLALAAIHTVGHGTLGDLVSAAVVSALLVGIAAIEFPLEVAVLLVGLVLAAAVAGGVAPAANRQRRDWT